MIVDSVVREHVETASFQWAQWRMLLDEDPIDQPAANWVSRRLECNLDGIRIAGQEAWPFAVEAFETYPERGELFVTSFLALELRDKERVEQAASLAAAASDGPKGLNGAFEWQPKELTWPYVSDWMLLDDPIKAGATMAALIFHKHDPAERLEEFFSHSAADVRAGACRLAAVCKRQDLADRLTSLLSDDNGEVRVSAAKALSDLGHRDGNDVLRANILAMDENWTKALRSLVAVTDRGELTAWLTELYRSPDTQRITVRGAGMLGEATYAGWLTENMEFPNLAADAGKAFIEMYPEAWDEDLFSTEPQDFNADFSALLEDAEDALPVASRFRSWLEQHRA